MTARALTTRERDAFRLARLVAAESCPYFMHALFAASPVAVEGLGTFAVVIWGERRRLSSPSSTPACQRQAASWT